MSNVGKLVKYYCNKASLFIKIVLRDDYNGELGLLVGSLLLVGLMMGR